MMSGGVGIAGTEKLAERLLQLPGDFQIVALAGRNAGMLASLQRIAARFPGRLTPMGYTRTIERAMAASDLAITKPGGLTVSECLAVGLPMIVVSPIPGQEERNADYLLENGAALKACDEAGLAYRVQLLTAMSSASAACANAASRWDGRRRRAACCRRCWGEQRGLPRLPLRAAADVDRGARPVLCPGGDPDRGRVRLGRRAAHVAHRRPLAARLVLGRAADDRLPRVGIFVHGAGVSSAGIHAGQWSLRLEARIIGSVMLFWIIEDFLWFVLNPAFGLAKFQAAFVPWHKHWLGAVPTDYVTFSIGALLLILWSFGGAPWSGAAAPRHDAVR